jgi:hypothetical protein
LDKSIRGSWIWDDCMAERAVKEKIFSTLTIQDGSSSVHHEHMGDAIKSDVTPNTPPVDDTDPRFGKNLIPVTQMA